MPKLKTKSSLKKRFSRTGTGKIKFKPAGKRHGMSKRSNKFIRSTKRSAIMSPGDAALIDHLAEEGQCLADLNAALPMPRKFEWRRHETGGIRFFVNLAGRLCILVFFQCRLGIKRIDVRRGAVHEQKNDSFGLGRKMRARLGCAGSCLLAEYTRHAKVAETSCEPLEHVAAINF